MVEELRAGLLHAQERVQELGEAVGLEQVGGDGSDFNVGELLDNMVSDFQSRWGDGSDLLSFKYRQLGTGKGQPCGYTKEQLIQFACDPRMIDLPYVSEEDHARLWKLVETELEKIVREKLVAAGGGVTAADVSAANGVASTGGWAGGGSRRDFAVRKRKLVLDPEEVQTYHDVKMIVAQVQCVSV